MRRPTPCRVPSLVALVLLLGSIPALAGAQTAARVSAISTAPPLLAQATGCQPDWLPTFGGMPGANNEIRAQAVFDDGAGPELYVGGTFGRIGGIEAVSIARWDGSTWRALGVGVNGAVDSFAVFDDGSGPALYVGGEFNYAGGAPASGIAKWKNSSWSPLGAGLGSSFTPRALALLAFDDGSGPALFVGGRFITAGGQAADSIAKWSGSVWSSIGSGASADVTSLATFDDGSGPALYAGGQFGAAGGVVVNHVARWDGTGWSALGSGTSSIVRALVTFDEGSGARLFAGGSFTTAGGQSATGIARWDGSQWSAVGGGLGAALQPEVDALRVYPGGSAPALYAGGTFDSAGGASARNLARWDGTSWSALGSGVADGYPRTAVLSLCVFDAGAGDRLFLAGNFTMAGDRPANRLAYCDGAVLSPLTLGANNSVRALSTLDAGSGLDLYAAGGFTGVGGVPANHIARWDGHDWHALGDGVRGPGSVPVASALAAYDDGSGPALFVGGSISSAGGVPVSNIAKWDGATWSALGSGVDTATSWIPVQALCVFDDGSGPALFVGGEFTSAGGVPANSIAKWNGSQWSALGQGVTYGPVLASVSALAVYDDGTGAALYAAGIFSTAGGVSAHNIARWDGQTWSPLGAGTDGSLAALLVYDDGSGPELFVGGWFQFAGGQLSLDLAKWNGSSWTAFGNPWMTLGWVDSLCAYDDGQGAALYVGGNFLNPQGDLTCIARRDASGWSDAGSGMDEDVFALAVYDHMGGPALFAGGSFPSCYDTQESFLSKWGLPQGCWPLGQEVCDPGLGGTLACPCSNPPAGVGFGCDNSAHTGGARIDASGIASLVNDSLVFTTSAERPSAPSLVLQGSALNSAGTVFGQGVRCITGALKRLYVKTALGGSISAPAPGDASVHARSAAVGDPITQGTHRYYSVYYRDPNVSGGCPATSAFNITQQIDIPWHP